MTSRQIAEPNEDLRGLYPGAICRHLASREASELEPPKTNATNALKQSFNVWQVNALKQSFNVGQVRFNQSYVKISFVLLPLGI